MTAGPSGAAVYKWVDDQGQTQYSDQPHPDAEEVKDLEVQTYPAPPPAPGAVETPAPPLPAGYDAIEVQAPANDETIWDNTGNVAVRITLAPALQVALGHKVVVSVDGERISEPEPTTVFQLSNLDRGTHTVQATVVDGDGRDLAVAKPVTFHLKKHSALLPAPAGPAPTPASSP